MNNTAIINIDKIQLKKLAKNLCMLIAEHNVTESEVAQSLNIPVMTIRRLTSGETTDPRISTLKLIADYFKVSVDALIKDNNPKTIGLLSNNTPQFVPILDWEVATKANPIKDLDLKTWKEWQPIALGHQTPLSENAFALKSRPSMQPRFPIGTLFIIDPNEIPTDGDIILVRMKADDDLSLRELIIDSPRWQLQPIIVGSETLFYDTTQHSIAGVVVMTMLHARKTR